MNPTESCSNNDDLYRVTNQALPASDVELMAINDILHQEDLEILKQQIKAAHQLLNYQRDIVHSLTEKLNLKDACLSKAEEQTAHLKRQVETQKIELSEAQSICSDLRELLKRQQRRSPQPPKVEPSNNNKHFFKIHSQRLTQRDTISFGYESLGNSEHTTHPLTKAPPVAAWSANQEPPFPEEAIFYQRMTTLVMDSTTRVSNLPTNPVINMSAEIVSQPENQTYRRHSVELPRFAVS